MQKQGNPLERIADLESRVSALEAGATDKGKPTKSHKGAFARRPTERLQVAFDLVWGSRTDGEALTLTQLIDQLLAVDEGCTGLTGPAVRCMDLTATLRSMVLNHAGLQTGYSQDRKPMGAE